MTYEKPKSVLDCAIRLSDLGYFPVPIPAGHKGPVIDGWQHLQINFDNAADYFTQPDMLVGILHTNVLALDVDVYDAALSKVIVDEAVRRFPGVLERIGQAPKSALFFRLEAPGFKVKNTERHEVISEDGEVISAQVEVRSVTRQIVVYGKHPATGRSYTWPRGHLWETPWGDLPAAEQADIEQFRDWCNDQIRKWAGVADEKIVDIGLYPRHSDDAPEEEDFRRALDYIPPDLGYDEWLSVLMGIHDFYAGSTTGLEVACQWSMPYPHYTRKEVETKWRSFEAGKGTSYRSVFYQAKRNGAPLAEWARERNRSKPRGTLADDFGAPPERMQAQPRDIEEDTLTAFDTTPLTRDELRSTAPREWLYGYKLIRGFCSVLVSPGGTGKSAWTAAIAADMASDRATLHDVPHKRLKVWVYNLEDPRDETLRKFAALERAKGLSSEALENIVVTSGRDRSLIVAEEVERGVYIATPDVQMLIDAIKGAGIDVLIVDPAVRCHRLPENDNKAIDLMMDQFAHIAHAANCAVLLVHHTRKGFVAGEMDSMRGASSMASAARVALTLQTMTQEEAVDMNIPEADRRFYVRMDNAKQNLSPPSLSAEWLKLESVSIENGNEEYPDGDFVQVVTKWAPPDPWADVGPVMTEIIARIERGYVYEDGTTEPFSPSSRAKDKWVANAVLASFPSGEKSGKQAMAVINHWIEKGFLEKRKYKNRNADEREGVFVVNQEGASNAD